MRKLEYQLVDVFTDVPFGGNQLAVFVDGSSVPAEMMQVIARELNLSETTFVLPPENPGAQFRLKIFTPAEELPFAGHPTVGTGFVLKHLGLIPNEGNVVFEENVGLIPVTLSRDGRVTMTQPTPQFGDIFADRQIIADMLSIAADCLADLPIQVVSSGVPFLYVPVTDLATIRKIKLRTDLWERILKGWSASNVLVFTREVEQPDSTVHSRVFAPAIGIVEDPATGGASGPLGAYLVKHGVVSPMNSRVSIISEQGFEMGRPSKIYIDLQMSGDSFRQVQVGGYTQFIGGGYLQIE
jgi:trans-2,3-dihydro-3-hydroxyanthranilate isomerase